MKQVLVNLETIEKTARLAELAAKQEDQLNKLASDRANFNTKLVPEIVDSMIKNGIIDSSQAVKAAKELGEGDFTKIAHTLLFLVDKVGAPSMGAPAAQLTTSKVASSNDEQLDAHTKFERAILG